MESPKITIVTATYNAVATLEQSIQSVIRQTYPNIEYIIIDGQSTDGTVDIIKKYSDYIDYWVSEKDVGLYDALNKGIKMATGDYIQIIGADDLLIHEGVTKEAALLLSDFPMALSTAIYEVDENLRLERSFDHELRRVGKKKYPWIHHQGLYISREYMLTHLFDLRYKIRADLKLLLGLFFDDCNVKYSDMHTVYFALSGISTDADNRGVVCREEEHIYSDYGIVYKWSASPESKWKSIIKNTLKRIGLFQLAQNIKRRYVEKGWTPHHCNWPLCRWCHRS